MASRARARQCSRGLHTIPAGVRRCEPCRRVHRIQHKREQRAAVAKPTLRANATAALRALHLPLGEILAGAACGPESADLFDVGAPRAEKPAERERHARAKAICAGCPVRASCYADAFAGRQLGVYGGVVMDQGFWSVQGRKGLVQSVQDVQDSSAC